MKLDPQMFVCTEHQFVTVVTGPGEITCRGTPGHRKDGCARCDAVVDEAFAYAGISDPEAVSHAT